VNASLAYCVPKAKYLNTVWLLCGRMFAVVFEDNIERLYSNLNQLMVEGDLLEVSLPEKLQLRSVLRTCRPADYEQFIFGFPVCCLLVSFV